MNRERSATAVTETGNSDNGCPEPVCRQVPSAVPPIVEIAVVLLLAVIPDIYSSFVSWLEPMTVSFAAIHIWLVVRTMQVAAPVLLLIHLTGGNWYRHGLHHRPRLIDAAIAVALVVTGYFAGEVVFQALVRVGFDVDSDYYNPISDEQPPHSQLILFFTILASGIANGFAEELVMRSWLIPKLEEVMKSKVAAVGITSWFFAFCHLYQGIAAASMMLAIGIIFGTYFVCFRRFWPLVIAHAAMDVIPYYW